MKGHLIFSTNFRALKAPGWMKKWHCGVRAKSSGKLIAFISAIPSVIRVYDKVFLISTPPGGNIIS